uniref:ubiquitinyl hydrolase 1 n=1 Tax=Haemonchus placei TaxID=6290 RepID=A0A158QLE3_HAEPC
LWNCVRCDSSESPWLCLACGLIFCGRYVNAHGLKHHNEMKHPRHCVLMHCQTYEVFPVGITNVLIFQLSFSPSCPPSPNVDPDYNSGKQPRVRVELRGLKNLGNTCFMNSVIQVLSIYCFFRSAQYLPFSTTDVFRGYLVQLPLLQPDDDVGDDHQPLASPRYNTRRALFQSVWKISPRFRGYQQQDAHEFLRCTMDRVHSELRRCRLPESVDQCESPNGSAVTTLFEGSLQSQVVCLTCHTASNKHDPFLDLSLDIFVPAANGRASNVRLSECIKRFFAKEELDHCEQYMCSNCKDKRPSTKQLFLRVLPNVLCLHLKRFRWSHFNRGKLDNMVDFPLSGLDITPFMIFSVCSFSSVVMSINYRVTSGHYTTYGQRDGHWYHFNDASVKACSEQTVLKQKAYLLFYTRSSRRRS